jgi:hypothetical protein
MAHISQRMGLNMAKDMLAGVQENKSASIYHSSPGLQ